MGILSVFVPNLFDLFLLLWDFLQHKCRTIVPAGPHLPSEVQTVSDIDFYIDGVLAFCVDPTSASRRLSLLCRTWFTLQIQRLLVAMVTTFCVRSTSYKMWTKLWLVNPGEPIPPLQLTTRLAHIIPVYLPAFYYYCMHLSLFNNQIPLINTKRGGPVITYKRWSSLLTCMMVNVKGLILYTVCCFDCWPPEDGVILATIMAP